MGLHIQKVGERTVVTSREVSEKEKNNRDIEVVHQDEMVKVINMCMNFAMDVTTKTVDELLKHCALRQYGHMIRMNKNDC